VLSRGSLKLRTGLDAMCLAVLDAMNDLLGIEIADVSDLVSESITRHADSPRSESVRVHTSSSYQRHSGQSIHVEMGNAQFGQE
jgi:hypothetical protein